MFSILYGFFGYFYETTEINLRVFDRLFIDKILSLAFILSEEVFMSYWLSIS